MARNTVKTSDFGERLLPIAEALRRDLVPVVDRVTDGIHRPNRLMRPLDLDKTLASRIIQALRHEEPLEFLHRLPAPSGLRILMKAARQNRVPAGICDRAENAIDTFQALIDATPGGRGSIDGWIAAHSASARERTEHRSKQAVYKAMSYLLGFHCDIAATTLVLQPSEDGSRVDGFELHQRLGLRRLRPSAPVVLFSINLERGDETGGKDPWIETLDGEFEGEDSMRFLLTDSTSHPLPGMKVVLRGTHHIFTLTDEDSSIDEPLNLSSGYIVRNGWRRYASADRKDDSSSYLLNHPCRILVRDVFLHEDLWPNSNPEINLRLPNPSGTDPRRYEGLLGHINTLDMHVPIEQLGQGLDRVAQKELPRYPGLLENSFERVGWDPARFRGYRSRTVYPLPMITMTWWFRLPE